MRRLAYVAAAVLALAPLAAAGTASAAPAHPASPSAHAVPARMRPLNDFPGAAEAFTIHNEAYQEDDSNEVICARIDSAGALILGSGDCREWFFNLKPGAPYGELVDNSNATQCLYFDASGVRDGIIDSYDQTGCNANSAADMWASSSNNTWSQWWTHANNNDGEAMWAFGTGSSNPMTDNLQNGQSPYDHWYACTQNMISNSCYPS
jgi:hypothetical protein